MTHDEREARKAAILVEMEQEGADLTALEEEMRSLCNADAEERAAEAAKAEMRKMVAAGTIGDVITEQREEVKPMIENRSEMLRNTGKAVYSADEVRSVLISSNTLATPTEVNGINDIPGVKYSTLLDMVTVVNCVGMGSNKVAYVAQDAAYAADQTEGSEADTKEPTFGYVTITPTSIACKAQISKQARKQSPLQYEAKINAQSIASLKKAAVKKVVAAAKASTLADTVNCTVASGNGKIDEKTLRNIVLSYGGDENVMGDAVLVLNKTDLLAFGDVRGTNEKKAVYEITPDGSNPNTGTIKDGGLVVKYVLCNELTACHGTAQEASTGAAKKTMMYGNMRNLELDLFSDYEVNVSSDFAFTSLMDTIVGDCEIGTDLVVNKGIIWVTIPKAAG